MTLWVLCEHGEQKAHAEPGWPLNGGNWCPGGRPPTELEVMDWLESNAERLERAAQETDGDMLRWRP